MDMDGVRPYPNRAHPSAGRTSDITVATPVVSSSDAALTTAVSTIVTEPASVTMGTLFNLSGVLIITHFTPPDLFFSASLPFAPLCSLELK